MMLDIKWNITLRLGYWHNMLSKRMRYPCLIEDVCIAPGKVTNDNPRAEYQREHILDNG